MLGFIFKHQNTQKRCNLEVHKANKTYNVFGVLMCVSIFCRLVFWLWRSSCALLLSFMGFPERLMLLYWSNLKWNLHV